MSKNQAIQKLLHNDLYSCNRTGKQHQYLQYGNQRSHEDRYCEAPKADWKGYRRK